MRLCFLQVFTKWPHACCCCCCCCCCCLYIFRRWGRNWRNEQNEKVVFFCQRKEKIKKRIILKANIFVCFFVIIFNAFIFIFIAVFNNFSVLINPFSVSHANLIARDTKVDVIVLSFPLMINVPCVVWGCSYVLPSQTNICAQVDFWQLLICICKYLIKQNKTSTECMYSYNFK